LGIPCCIYSDALQNRRGGGVKGVSMVNFPTNKVVGLLRVISKRRWFIALLDDEKALF